MIPSRFSVRGPELSHSRMTISVEAGAVAMAMAPSSSATCHGCPSTRTPMVTSADASTDSTSVRYRNWRPRRRNRENSKTDPMEKRIRPSATSLSTSSASRFSAETQPRMDGPSATPARM